ncbi:hypothetical protein SMD22_02165 (plasmid) [Brevibacillus halotolerans]|nr:hypothetical protein SMD22_02165 [Brevibacillus halotolerans]
MRELLAKFKKKQFVQNIIIEVVADLLMIAIGIVVAYYIKKMLF